MNRYIAGILKTEDSEALKQATDKELKEKLRLYNQFTRTFKQRLTPKIDELNNELKSKYGYNGQGALSSLHVCLWLWKNDPSNLENAVKKFLDENFYPSVIKKSNGSAELSEALIDAGMPFIVYSENKSYLCVGYYKEQDKSFLVLYDFAKADKLNGNLFFYMGANNCYQEVVCKELNNNMKFVNICRRKPDIEKIRKYCDSICPVKDAGEKK